jgi:DHA1 family bicyclomycin/chloramphenicol resistance-like MFS transporter
VYKPLPQTVTSSPVSAIPVVTEMSRGGRLRLILLLGSLIALGPLTIDTYLPALPAITGDLDAGPAAVQLTLTGTLLGLALGQLLIGPLSDTHGRRGPLLAGVALHVVASLACALAPTIAVLGVLRVLQGVGAAAGGVVAMAVVRDLFAGRAAATLLSRLILVMGVAPIIAPALGGEVLRFGSWRWVFAALAVISLVLLPLTWWQLRETLPPARRRPGGLAAMARTSARLLRDRVFVGLVLVAGLSFAALFAYIAGSSFVFQQEYGLSEQAFGLLFGVGAFWLIAATQLNAYLLRRFEPRELLLAAMIGGVASATALVVTAATGAGGVTGLLIPLWAVLAAIGLAIPNAPALALSRHGEAAGTAAALLGAANFGIGGVISPLVGALGNDAVAMAATMAVLITAALGVLVVVVAPWQLTDLDEPATAGL